MSTAIHLALKEIWRNRGRFLLFSLVVALITLLILFIAALGEGLGSGNREYLEKLNADLIVYQDTARLQIAGSRVGCRSLFPSQSHSSCGLRSRPRTSLTAPMPACCATLRML